MQASSLKATRRARRKIGIRKRVTGTSDRPRLTVYRSLKHIYAQIVNDLDGRTLVSAGSVQDKVAGSGNKVQAEEVGKLLAEKAKAAGITQVAMDRNGFRYHGRIKTLADAARKAGLSF